MMSEEKARYDQLLKQVMALAAAAPSRAARDASVFLDGAVNLLDHTDDVSRCATIFRTFEEKSRLVRILGACLDGERRPRHHRPRERDPACGKCPSSRPAATVDGREVFGIGILGGTRMEYSRAVALVGPRRRLATASIQELRA